MKAGLIVGSITVCFIVAVAYGLSSLLDGQASPTKADRNMRPVPLDEWVCPDPQMVKLYPRSFSHGEYMLLSEDPGYTSADRAFCVYPAARK